MVDSLRCLTGLSVTRVRYLVLALSLGGIVMAWTKVRGNIYLAGRLYRNARIGEIRVATESLGGQWVVRH